MGSLRAENSEKLDPWNLSDHAGAGMWTFPLSSRTGKERRKKIESKITASSID